MNPIIVGAGPVGLAVAEELVAIEQSPILISRSEGESPHGCERIVGSIFDSQLFKSLPSHPIIFHCANAPYHRWTKDLPPLWDAVIKRGEETDGKIVAITNLYAFGYPHGAMTANHSKNPHTRKGQVRKEVESKLMDGRVPATLIRGSDFYGPRVLQSALGERYFSPIIQGKNPSWIGSTDRTHSFAFIRDVAKTMVQAEESEQWGQEWIVPERAAYTMDTLTSMVAHIVGRPLSIRSMGRGTLRLGGFFSPAAYEMLEMFYEFEQDFIIDGRATVDMLGITPTPVENALKETVEWYRSYQAGEAARKQQKKKSKRSS